MMLDPYQPRTPQTFWCKKCDQQEVDSTRPVTGDFYVVGGHAYDKESSEYDGEYLSVMFAVCKSCQAVLING
jgi:hypothetical protein